MSAPARARPGVGPRPVTGCSGHFQRWPDDGDPDLTPPYDLGGTPSPHAPPPVRERPWAVAPQCAGAPAPAGTHPAGIPAADGHASRGAGGTGTDEGPA
ncbi:hypothetical protein GCM10027168_45850 [Streptomyces capparidis]